MVLLNEFLCFLIIFVIVGLIGYYYYYYKKIYRIEKFLKNFPAPPTVPWLGNAHDFTTTSAFLTCLHDYTKIYGKFVHVKIGPFEHVLLCADDKFIKFILSNSKILNRSFNLRYLEPWIGDGLVTAKGDHQWKIHRRIITPAFHFKILEQFVETFEACGDVLIDKLSKISGSQNVDIFPYITLCTLDIICETAMGTKIDVQNNESSAYFKSVREMGRIFAVRTISPLKNYDFIFKFTKDYKMQNKAVKILHNFTNNVINKKRHESGEKKQKENDDEKKKVFIDLIFEASVKGQSLSPKEIREEVDTFMFAGHDTTACALSFILFCLAQHKDVQNKIIEEQEQIFGKNKNPKVTYEHLQQMKYLEMVIKESMRIYPPVPVFNRKLDQDIEYDGKIIPKGITILLFVHGMHMNPEYFPNPEKFDPSRFENNTERPAFTYIPFSAGSRNCIGQKYALVELKSTTSKIIRNFEIFPATPEHTPELAAETVLKSLNGVKIGLTLR